MTDKIKIKAELANPVMLAGKKQTVFLRVGLTGFPIKIEKVAPLNVALVIDQSGSMQGEKLRSAKDAAIMVVERLRPEDILSIITYDHQANILLPATKVQDKENIINAINQLTAGGQTALYDGVEKAAKEVRQFLNKKRINRMVLVSDGLANIGPSTPEELGTLSASLSKENIVITTIGLGLGYHEDLMTELAKKSDGNHAFVENAHDLVPFFDHEFSDIFSVVAQEVNVTIIGINGTRPLRVLGREVQIQDNQFLVKLNQLYSEQEKYVLVELEVPSVSIPQEQMIAGVAVVYRNMNNGKNERQSHKIIVTFTDSHSLIEEKTNAIVMMAAIEQLAVEKNEFAVTLRDEGKITEARQVLLDNVTFLAEEAAKYRSNNLKKLKDINTEDAQQLEGDNWIKQRKSMRRQQYKSKTQQTY